MRLPRTGIFREKYSPPGISEKKGLLHSCWYQGGTFPELMTGGNLEYSRYPNW